MCSVGILILASLFAVTESQVSITADKYTVKDGESVVLTCTVPDFTDNIFVIQGTANRALCIANSICTPSNSSLYTSTKSGSTIVTFTIISFSKARDVGSWICRYGSNPDSTPAILSEFTESLETSTTFESSSIIESTSTSILVESNAGISPTDVSQLNTLNIFSFSSDAENFSSSIFSSDRKHTSASFQTENLETIDTTNAFLFINTTSLTPNSVLSSMSLIQNFDSYKTSILSSMIESVTISSLTSSYFDAVSLFSETTIGLLNSGVYLTTSEISPGLIYSALDSSYSTTTGVCPTNTFTETVSTGMTSAETVSKGIPSLETISAGMTSIETVSIGMTSTETVSIGMTSTETISTGMTSIETISAVMTPTDTLSTDMTSTETVSIGMTSIETVSAVMTSIETIRAGMTSTETVSTGMTSTETISAGMTPTDTLSTGMTSSHKMFDVVSEVNETTSITSSSDANVLTRNSLSSDIPVLQTTFDSLTTYGSPSHQSMESAVITSAAMFNFLTSISEEVGFSSSFTIEALRSTNHVLTADEYESQTSKLVYINTSDSQFTLSNSELSSTSSTIIFEERVFGTTPLSHSSVIDTVNHTSNFVMTSSLNEQSVSVTQNSFLSSLTMKPLIQTSSVQKNEAESDYTERYSSLPTKLFSSMTDQITETVSYDDKFILLTFTEQILLVASSFNTMGSFTGGFEDSVLITESFVKMISRSSNELATSSSSLDTFSPKYVKTTTIIQHSLSESSKDNIFISAVSGTIGAFILVVLIAMVVRRYLLKRNKFKDKKDDEISNQYEWSDDGGMNSYNKNYTSREYPFSGSIHLPLHSYDSPYFPYANYYKKNWDDNT